MCGADLDAAEKLETVRQFELQQLPRETRDLTETELQVIRQRRRDQLTELVDRMLSVNKDTIANQVKEISGLQWEDDKGKTHEITTGEELIRVLPKLPAHWRSAVIQELTAEINRLSRPEVEHLKNSKPSST